jgi:hypothetical protein
VKSVRATLGDGRLARVITIEYGIKSVRVCYSPSTNVSISATHVWQQLETAAAVAMHADPVRRNISANGCYTVTDPSPIAVRGGAMLTLAFTFTAAGTAYIGSVVTTWTPMP